MAATSPASPVVSRISAQHPRYIWRATAQVNRAQFMEFLFDATDMPGSLPVYHILWYQPDKMKPFMRRWLDRAAIRHFLQKETPPDFLHLLRASMR